MRCVCALEEARVVCGVALAAGKLVHARQHAWQDLVPVWHGGLSKRKLFILQIRLSLFRLSSFGGNLRLEVVFVVVVFIVSFVLCVVSIERNLWFEFVHDL